FRNDSLRQNVHYPSAQNQPQDPSTQRAQEAFHQQLLHHPPRRSSQSRANRKLALPCRRLSQQQIRHVSARNQQDQSHHRKQRHQRRAGIPLNRRPSLRPGIQHNLLA